MAGLWKATFCTLELVYIPNPTTVIKVLGLIKTVFVRISNLSIIPIGQIAFGHIIVSYSHFLSRFSKMTMLMARISI